MNIDRKGRWRWGWGNGNVNGEGVPEMMIGKGGGSGDKGGVGSRAGGVVSVGMG